LGILSLKKCINDFLTLVDQQEGLGVQLTADEPCSHSHLKPNPNKLSIAQQRSKITI
jgi:hypothetical protein